jgi:hypothetical protein
MKMFSLSTTLIQKNDELYGEIQMNVEVNGKSTEILEHTSSYSCRDEHELFVARQIIDLELSKKLVEISEVYPFIIKEFEGWDTIVAKSKIGDTPLSRIENKTDIYSRMHSPNKPD